MLIDYYQILRVPVDADLETIKKAYRARALECHPDRGGSHEAMLRVIEAFQILASPETRRRYDEARREEFNQNAQDATQADTAHARQRAEDYPRDWNAFEAWMELLYKDFANAKYGELYNEPPENSVSGGAFWIVGAVLGGFIGYQISGEAKGAMALGAAAGAGAGVALHKQISGSMREPTTPANSDLQPNAQASRTVIASCSSCGQQLRVAVSGNPLRLRCPKCKNEFSFEG